MDLGPHAAFIWASYAIFFLVLSVLIFRLVWNGERLKNTLAKLEEQGVSRRGRAKASPSLNSSSSH